MQQAMKRSVGVLALLSALVIGACFDDQQDALLTPGAEALSGIRISVSSVDARIGDRITVALKAESSEQLAGIQGRLVFDARRLSYAGQMPIEQAVVVLTNDEDVGSGVLPMIAMSPTGLRGEYAAYLAFDVRGGGYRDAIRFEVVEVVNMKSAVVTSVFRPGVSEDRRLPAPDKPVNWDHLDWALFLDPSLAEEVDMLRQRGDKLPSLPPEGAIYGDSNLSGTITFGDYTDIGQTALGGRELIIGTTTVDRVTAANVRPAAGTCPVGAGGTNCLTRVITVGDATPVGQYALGARNPEQVHVGDPIPLPKGTYAASDTVFVSAQTVTGTMTFTADKIYVLTGVLTVGNEATGAAGAGTIVIDPGTRFESDLNSAIYVTRNGRIFSNGEPTRPVTFTCRGVKEPGCWGGVFVAGNAVVNEQDAGLTQFAPFIPVRNEFMNQNQRSGEGGAVNYGGGNDADNSGTIRYTRFLYGGKILAANNELNNLTIGACGSGTILEFIQVHGGLDDGLEFFGGRCNVRYVYATGNDDDNFDYSFGYDGDVQFVITQNCRLGVTGGQLPSGGFDCDENFEVDNTETAATYNTATPRTNPRVYNVTSIGGAMGGNSSHFEIRRGAATELANVLVVGNGTVFKNSNETASLTPPCAANLNYTASIVVLGNGTLQSNPAACPAGQWLVAHGVNADQKGAYNNELKDPFNVVFPDFRPVGGGVQSSVSGVAPITPPGGSIFDQSATYFGAVAPIGATQGAIPWYAGWTVGWQGPNER